MRRHLVIVVLLAALFVPSASQAFMLPVAGFENALTSALRKEQRGQHESAQRYWEKVVRLGEQLLEHRPDRVRYLMSTARAYYALGDYQRCVVYYERLMEMDTTAAGDKYPWANVYLGLAYARLGNAERTAYYWNRVPMRLGNVYTVIQEQLARLQLLANQEAGS